ncbi:Hypothetical protein VV2_1695 [Vibrio vulnificus CMCP6]|uniref:Uncharacterized protein n=1 Tax=Vibrio vulnificus (strain CMCP6) TaxID=216895 RepID=A0A3Q0MFI7_VIBVU|nr:Hypothetical protein VV2_1695 [Vibrio vulnificus CMCP6]
MARQYLLLRVSQRYRKPWSERRVNGRILHRTFRCRRQLNGDLVTLFVDAQVYLVIKNKPYKNTCSECGNFYHHVCDFD